MKIHPKAFLCNGLSYVIRSATEDDARKLSEVRLQIDGETEYLDREQGEAFLDESAFKQIIRKDTENSYHLFLVAEVDKRIVGFSRCEGNKLKRLAHKVEFGVCVLKEWWGYGIGKHLLAESIHWADTSGIKKMNLSVLETNGKAIKRYEQFGFEVEGVLQKDKRLSDGTYYNTVLMGRFKE
ncbi:GNAT family N-acetyltransferase [Halalkalibacterium halodurans]|uniref:GNAT family N-acetyltransferase n=1 Tax=Halalkalibacterium halodurans TaxID=86665 RepID=UPI002E22BE61|nr:GNAT family N-acetyltransferase [Halalkalibacterium halodurans]MED4085836.1 GNAT family N-acetyltransferase [Halalkalibacterium halodurans]MED4105181.1 GNAT family N-acetyltransferase [Halalkalibacterium halodurans]MED4111099.1 GNAT family N-acetyltransferase [Halalkalibacterium halodurans]MED4125597.1 GNAT family N-acetyltransferase [Halalkalibacterium halodurans]